MIEKLSFSQARKLLDDCPESVLLDVREEEEYITGHAAGARLLPVGEISEETAGELIPDRDTPALVYCRSGYRSRLAARTLQALGYRRVYDLGSLVGWPYGME